MAPAGKTELQIMHLLHSSIGVGHSTPQPPATVEGGGVSKSEKKRRGSSGRGWSFRGYGRYMGDIWRIPLRSWTLYHLVLYHMRLCFKTSQQHIDMCGDPVQKKCSHSLSFFKKRGNRKRLHANAYKFKMLVDLQCHKSVANDNDTMSSLCFVLF